MLGTFCPFGLLMVLHFSKQFLDLLYLTLYRAYRNQPWLLAGDFNEILGNHEKIRGRTRAEAFFQDFRTLIRNHDLTDLNSIGNRFSWVGQRGTHQVQCCLDRTMANTAWFEAFPASETEFLEIGESDHRPLITTIAAEREEPRRMFKFDIRMKDKDGFADTVHRGWNGMGQTQLIQIPLAQMIGRCRQQISRWKRSHRCNVRENINLLRGRLDNAITSNSATLQERKNLKAELDQTYMEEKVYWQQKSRVQWLRSGDRNTTYFHAITKGKRYRNNISSLQDMAGVTHRGQRGIGRVAQEYFCNLFTSSPPDLGLYDAVFEGFPIRVTEDINTDLTREVTEEEIKQAMFDIGSHRAPGLDRFSVVFYHQYWDDLKTDIVCEVQQFFETCVLDKQLNHTNICLIPKIYPPSGMTDFRPIALCNVAYKVISKVLINRLKIHLHNLITENQQAFIPGRVITDNIIIAHEVFHCLKARKRQATSYMAVKTDITKAYDMLEWGFLEETMKRIGFHVRWIQWIMACVNTVSFSVLINGSPEGYFEPGRGIRQGDPLSPYLFILCAEVLSHMMNRAMVDRSLLGVKISLQAPPVNHLLFADDSLFFSLANARACKKLKKILGDYERASGQAVNLMKSSITFGHKVSDVVRTQMRNILGIHNEGGIGKYLGMSEQFTRRKSDMFTYIVDKVKAVTQGWSQKYLSPGCKEVLLKSIALAMPIFSMNVFRLLKEVCDEINRVLARFWWGSGENKGMHWYDWKRVSLPKSEGGLGFRDLEKFNQALLGKQVWRILQNPGCLMARILKARYFQDGDILSAVLKKKASYAWKSILYGRDLVKQGMRYIIGDGSLINTWTDPWIPDHTPRAPRPRIPGSRIGKVIQLFSQYGNGWDEQKVRAVIVDEDIPKVLALKLSTTAKQDLLEWHYKDDGIYTVKSGYWLSTHLPTRERVEPTFGNPSLKKKIWNTKMPSKIHHFIWKVLSRSIASGANLKRRHIMPDA